MVEREFQAAFADALDWSHALDDRAVLVPPAAHHVEVLQRKPSWIDFRMAGRTRLFAPMLVEQLANRICAPDIRLDRRHARRWRWRRHPQNPLHNPGPAQHG